MTSSFTGALRKHLRWQRALLERLKNVRQRQNTSRFLVLRPGDKLTVCDSKGMKDVRAHCYRASAPQRTRPTGVHWDPFVIQGRSDLSRPIPGLGNVALSLISAAATAIVSRRVLLLENFSASGMSFGDDLRELLVESSGWAPYLAAAGYSETDGFMAHDDYTAFNTLCSSDLRHTPQARVWRIFSNQYFLPLLMLNPYHGRQMDAFAEKLESGGQSLWTPGLQALWTPNARLAARIAAFKAKAGFELGSYVAMHVRINFADQRDGSRRLHQAITCARTRLVASNTTKLFVATMYASNRRALKEALATDGISVHWLGRAMEAQGESREGSDSALADMVLMGGAREVLVTPGSTFGYVAQGLAGRRAITYGGTHTSRELVGPQQAQCSSVPTSEPNFHFLKHALRLEACKAGLRNARARGSEIYQRSSMQH